VSNIASQSSLLAASTGASPKASELQASDIGALDRARPQLRHPIAPTIRAHVCTVDRKVRVSGQFEDKVILVTGAARARAARMPCVAEEGGRCRHRRELQEA
jgi:hypothetical protein